MKLHGCLYNLPEIYVIDKYRNSNGPVWRNVTSSMAQSKKLAIIIKYRHLDCNVHES